MDHQHSHDSNHEGNNVNRNDNDGRRHKPIGRHFTLMLAVRNVVPTGGFADRTRGVHRTIRHLL